MSARSSIKKGVDAHDAKPQEAQQPEITIAATPQQLPEAGSETEKKKKGMFWRKEKSKDASKDANENAGQQDVEKSAGKEPTSNATSKGEIGGMQLYVLLAAIMMSGFIMSMNGTVLGTAIPSITDEFHTVDDIGWYASAYLMAK
jgi:hypothetical protein